MRLYLLTAICAAAVTLAGCVPAHLTKNRGEGWESPNNGLVIGSMTVRGDGDIGLMSVLMSLATIDGERAGQANLDKHLAEEYEDFPVSGGEHGRIFVLELPPGTYFLAGYKGGPASFATTGPNIFYRAAPGSRSTFNLAAGQALYIGSYEFTTTYGKQRSIWGTHDIITGLNARVEDKYERDINIFRERYKEVIAVAVSKRLLRELGPFEKERAASAPIIVPIIIN